MAIIHNQLMPSVEKKIMTLAQRIEEKGLEKGLLQGKLKTEQEIAQRMPNEGLIHYLLLK